ncbi:MAG: hypoxanthine phosphoribosyltransferase [Rhodospirillales bacterium]|nr:hypoxanthine phosphoribosyltransferase [Alphaproteobacteria bacterium]MBL6958172.1 hypoxanthine phosphoribosyltransferase [Rhodospirillales bacterium]
MSIRETVQGETSVSETEIKKQVRPLYDETEIASRVEELAKEIGRTFEGDFMIVGVLKGCFVFVADLIRQFNRNGMPLEVEFIRLSSYGRDKESSGDVKLLSDLPEDIAGKQVLLVDDIVDTGLSLDYAVEHILKKGASQVKTCVLLDKPSRRANDFKADFIGFSIDDVFVVGYGIDYAGQYRSLPYIGIVD